MKHLFALPFFLFSCSTGKTTSANCLQNEQWSIGTAMPASARGTTYFLFDDGTFKATSYYSGGAYYHGDSKGIYFFDPETNELFLTHQQTSQMFQAAASGHIAPQLMKKEAIKLLPSSKAGEYTAQTFDDWEVKEGKHRTKDKPSRLIGGSVTTEIFFSYPIVFTRQKISAAQLAELQKK